MMDRRQMLMRLGLAASVITHTLPALAEGATAEPEVDAAIAELIAAIVAETATFRSSDAEDDDACDAAVTRSYEAGKAVLALPSSVRSHPDFLPAVALVQRRWLVMEGDYADPHMVDVCLLVDGILAGTRFDGLPMLWQIDGEQFDRRPSDAEFAAAMERAGQ